MKAPRPQAGPDSGGVDPIEETARQLFGVRALYPIQRFVIANTLDGCSQIVVLPTGAGKSLCWQVPMTTLEGPTVVVVPLLALLADQLRRLQAASVAAAVLRGGMGEGERQASLAALRSGRARALFTTPEFLATAWAQRQIGPGSVAHLVIDEAHCVCEWGATFRPAYLDLERFVRRVKPRVVTAFTATASARVIDAITAVLFADGSPRLVLADADRPGIFYRVVPSLAAARDVALLLGRRSGAALVFGPTRRQVEALARQLRRRLPGREVRFYHAGLDRAERAAAEAWFLPQTDAVLVATSAYGLGVDKPDIRTVVHAGAPPSVEAYLQESGRAGRDGAPAEAILVQPLRAAAPRSAAGSPERAREQAILGYARGGTGRCRREQLMRLLGQQPPACSGCDVCRGSALAAAEGLPQIQRHVRRHRRRCTVRETALALIGRGHRKAALPGWSLDDALAALSAMIAAGMLRRTRGPLWRHRLTPGRSCRRGFPGGPVL